MQRHLYQLTISLTDTDEGAPTSHHPMAIVLGVLIAAAVLILGGIFITTTLVICRRRSATSQLQQHERDVCKLRPNVYSEPPATLNTATVFSVPSHVPRGCCAESVPRVRFRTDSTDLQDRGFVYVGDSGSEESLAVSKRRNQAANGMMIFLIVKHDSFGGISNKSFNFRIGNF